MPSQISHPVHEREYQRIPTKASPQVYGGNWRVLSAPCACELRRYEVVVVVTGKDQGIIEVIALSIRSCSSAGWARLGSAARADRDVRCSPSIPFTPILPSPPSSHPILQTNVYQVLQRSSRRAQLSPEQCSHSRGSSCVRWQNERFRYPRDARVSS